MPNGRPMKRGGIIRTMNVQWETPKPRMNRRGFPWGGGEVGTDRLSMQAVF